MGNRGRSTTGRAAVPYQPRAPHIEAAKHLRLTVTRYIADRASLNEVKEAMSMLVAAAPVPGDVKVTGHTITDEQINELRTSLPQSPEFGGFEWRRVRECEWALVKTTDPECLDRVALARARCAEILTTRASSAKEK